MSEDRAKRNNLIGFVSFDDSMNWKMRLAWKIGLLAVAAERGYKVLRILELGGDGQPEEACFEDLQRVLVAGDVDAVMVLGNVDVARLQSLTEPFDVEVIEK